MRIRLRLYPVEDDGLMAFFDSIASPLQARVVQQALGRGVQGANHDDLADDQELWETLNSLVV